MFSWHLYHNETIEYFDICQVLSFRIYHCPFPTNSFFNFPACRICVVCLFYSSLLHSSPSSPRRRSLRSVLDLNLALVDTSSDTQNTGKAPPQLLRLQKTWSRPLRFLENRSNQKNQSRKLMTASTWKTPSSKCTGKAFSQILNWLKSRLCFKTSIK